MAQEAKGGSLSSYEKKSLTYFLLVYLCSSFLFLSVAIYLFYKNEKESLVAMAHQKMQINAQNIAKQIIEAHMSGEHSVNIAQIIAKNSEHSKQALKQIQKEHLLGSEKLKSIATSDYFVALLDEKNSVLASNFEPIPKDKDGFFLENESYYLVDYSALNHMSVNKIIIKNDLLVLELNSLLIKTVWIFLFVTIAICLIGFYLGKLFLKPMRLEIERFNDFIAQSAHELNTPVASLLLIADMFKNEQNSQNVARLKVIARSIAGIYEDLSYFATRGIIKNSDEMLDVAEIANQRVAIFEESAKFKNIEISQILEEFYTLIDRTRAARLIDNLLSNAIKYTPNGGKILISVQKTKLTVEDSGSGIGDDFAKIAFDKYSRNSSAVSGLGLGLAIVKSICDDYNINIQIECSNLGGAKFILNWH